MSKCLQCLISQTTFANLILWAWFWWYLWVMFHPWVKSYRVLEIRDLLNAFVAATLLFIALNAATYKPPFNEYIKSPLKIFRFWLIPFCVSSISVSCARVGKDYCAFFFPKQNIPLIIHLTGLFSILIIGSIIHCYLQKLYNNIQLSNQKQNNGNDSSIQLNTNTPKSFSTTNINTEDLTI